MYKKKVTLAMPVYNVERTIESSLLSALEQTYEDIEFLVVDDCSPDNSVAIVEKLAREHTRGKDIRIVHHATNLNLGETRNTAIKEAVGEYIYFMDSDDIITPDCIEKLVKYMEETPVDFVASSRVRMTFDGTVLGEEIYTPALVENNGPLSVARFRYAQNHRILVETWNKLYRTAFLRHAKVECLPYVIVDDVQFNYQVILSACSCRLVPDVTYIYMIHKGQSILPIMLNRDYALYLADCFCKIRKKNLHVAQRARGDRDYNAIVTGVMTTCYLHAQLIFKSPMLKQEEKRRYISELLANRITLFNPWRFKALKQVAMLALGYTPYSLIWILLELKFKNTTDYKGGD